MLPHFVEGLQRAYPLVRFADYRTLGIDYNIKQDVTIENKRIIPIRWADEILKTSYNHCMRAKYDMYCINYHTWRNTTYERDLDREMKLKEMLGATGEYKVVNRYYGSESQLRNNIILNGSVIEMRTVPGYSIFDWSSILEGASEIHAVSSSILYILELLDLNMPLHLYPRKGDERYRQVEYLFTKEYKLH